MKTLHVLIFSCALMIAGVGFAVANSVTVNHTWDSVGNTLVSLGTCISGESACIGTSPNSYVLTRTVVTPSAESAVDVQISAVPVYVSHMICTGADAASVAGTIILYDSLTETGTVLYTHRVSALDNHSPVIIPILANAATGAYLGFTTTSDMYCTVFTKPT